MRHYWVTLRPLRVKAIDRYDAVEKAGDIIRHSPEDVEVDEVEEDEQD